MNRRINQAEAIRSTKTPCRVTHMRPFGRGRPNIGRFAHTGDVSRFSKLRFDCLQQSGSRFAAVRAEEVDLENPRQLGF